MEKRVEYRAPLRVGVLVSGEGTNLQAIIDAVERKALAVEIAVVVSNRKEAKALERARRHHLPTAFVDHKAFRTREDFDRRLVEILTAHGVDLVVCAGFMRVLSPVMVTAFRDRIINIHPSLLPAFPGTRAQADALRHGVKISGCTVHFVTEGIDEGPIIAQAAVPVYPDDTEETLAARIRVQEHRLLPMVIGLFAQDRLQIRERTVVIRDMPKMTPDAALRAPDHY